MPMPVEDLPPIDPTAAQRYAEAVGRYDGMRLSFGQDVSGNLPASLAELRRRLAAAFIPLTIHYVEEVDIGPRLQWRPGEEDGWEIGVARTGDPDWSPGKAEVNHKNAKAMDAAEHLSDALFLIERDWLAHKRALWIAARGAERTANQLLSMHLLQSGVRARQAEIDYVGNPGADPIRIDLFGKKYDSLVAALNTLAAVRKDSELDLFKRQQSVIGIAALGASLIPLRFAAELDSDIPAAVSDLEGLAGDTALRHAEALMTYLGKMRELAREHPILLVLQHLTERLVKRPNDPFTASAAQREIRDAIEAVREAIEELRTVSATRVIPTSVTGEAPPELTALVTAMAKSSRLAVWKLPLFMDRAITGMPAMHRTMLLALRRSAMEKSERDLFVREVALSVVEIGTSFIPPARIVGLAIALAVGLMRLHGTVKEYRELTSLYHASMDPAFLALGGEGHDPADPDMIVFDLFFLAFDAHGLGKAVR